MLKEFKEFVSRGNVLDLAVGVIIGGAFTSIVKALVNYLINPLIGLFVGGIDFSDWSFKVAGATFKFGSFINAVINFLIIAFVVFIIVKTVNKFVPKKAEEEENTDEVDNNEIYLKEIRDALVKDPDLLEQAREQSSSSEK
ncbi:large-conductance mechanosensitive channel protein MscL [Pediococcus acidilactici]|uniref:large-conductance mechanosensitive channel protein MscL n=1 Tax=Pediococcus acidilactici TaxID=1254 RepID=UPI000FFCA568|nr:large-conductance mechanosensitive channel protein MscL [Pediococcus acidilactici]MBW4797640.1 large-conductance mechanosensitive channel protein MscL [Pediococcus acidilactici]MBW9306397.1 large-conductance mechanosensitive channel protein MscL [Pediococcus acidilactici]MCE5961927.1 large-conductance mechanosensitive channel protein MscL [Pediococcus acidilactici]MCW8083061.1 large-conductance mechanosensitive channel protein MscL [Pediococcus acidilactici]MDB8857142.1 large-conductance me